jgi:hypothetical protein
MLITLVNHNDRNGEKITEKETRSLSRPISSVDRMKGYNRAVVTNPSSTPIYENTVPLIACF